MRGTSSPPRDRDPKRMGVQVQIVTSKNLKSDNNGPHESKQMTPATTTNNRNRGIHIEDVDDNPLDNFLRDDNPRKKASDYSKRRDSKRSSTAQSKKSKKSENSKKSSENSRRRTTSYAVISKKLPANFAENVLDLELLID